MDYQFPSTFPTLSGNGLLLREMSEVDVPAWFERACNPQSALLSGDPIPESIEVVNDWLVGHHTMYREQTAIRWAVVPTDAEHSIGSIGISEINTKTLSAELGAVIGVDYWNQGIVTRAGTLVIDYCLNKLKLTKIIADTLSTNSASQRVLEKLGFACERKIEGYRQPPEKILDGYLYSISRNKK